MDYFRYNFYDRYSDLFCFYKLAGIFIILKNRKIHSSKLLGVFINIFSPRTARLMIIIQTTFTLFMGAGKN